MSTQPGRKRKRLSCTAREVGDLDAARAWRDDGRGRGRLGSCGPVDPGLANGLATGPFASVPVCRWGVTPDLGDSKARHV